MVKVWKSQLSPLIRGKSKVGPEHSYICKHKKKKKKKWSENKERSKKYLLYEMLTQVD